jgi:hypothetical protein
MSSFMPIVDDETLEITNPILGPSEQFHIAINHGEMSAATNEQCRCLWLANGQQSLQKKGNGCSIHVSDFILETNGCLFLTDVQLEEQDQLPANQCLQVTDACKIIHPGKNGDAWWDMPQLLTQIKHAIPTFEYLYPSAVGVWIFDCSSAHEALSDDALNVKNMNVSLEANSSCCAT